MVIHRLKLNTGRRSALAFGAGLGMAITLRVENLWAATGFAAIDTPAIAVRFPSSVPLIAITLAGNRLVAVGGHGVIIFSDDDGVHWTQARVPVSATLTCVTFVTPEIGWAAGHFGVILRTSDSGESWALQLNGVQSNQLTTQAVQGLSPVESACPCAALAPARAVRFMNEGPDKPFFSLLALTQQRIIAFGAYRMAMLSDDGGNTWNDWSLHIYDRFSQNLYGSTQANGKIYLAGEAGLVFCSSDAGETFLPLAPTSPTTLFGIVVAADNALIVFGVAGRCFRSVDSGVSWSNITLPSQDNVVSARILRSGAVMLGVETGIVLTSTNNGQTFAALPDVAQGPLYDGEQLQSGGLILIGAAGVYHGSPNQVYFNAGI